MNIKNLISRAKELLNNMEKDHIGEFSAQCAYYVILSFIPFISLLLTLVQYTSIEKEQLFGIMATIIPSNMNDIVLGIVDEVYSQSIGTISISLIFTLFSADKGLLALIKGLHLIYNFDNNKVKPMIYLKITAILKTAAFVIIVIIGMVILVFGSTIISTVQNYFGLLQGYTIISEILAKLVFVFVTFVLFLCIYKFMSGYKITFKSQIKGAIFGSVALNVISFVFSKYLVIFKGFSTTYGSLTTLMLVLMWTYSCFYVVFLGAEINKIYSIKKL